MGSSESVPSQGGAGAFRPISSTPLQQIVFVLRKHLRIIAVCFAVWFSLALIYAVRQPRLYRATADVAINSENNSPAITKYLNAELGDTAPYSADEDTQVRVLQSRTVALNTARRLRLCDNVAFMRDARKLWLSRQGTNPSAVDCENVAVHALLANLSAQPQKDGHIVEVSFTGPDPASDAAIVNTLIDEFIDDSIRARYEAANRAARFLAQQLSDLRLKVEQSQKDLVTYEREHDILGVDEKQNVITAKLDDLNHQLTAAEGDRIAKESLYRTIVSGSLDEIPESKSSEALETLRLRDADLKNQYAQASTTLGPNHPRIVELSNQLKATAASIQLELKRLRNRAGGEYQAAVERERRLRLAYEAQKREANRLSESAIQYGLLKREADSNRQLYENLQERMKDAGVTAGLRSSNIRLIDSAETPLRPVSPSLAKAAYSGLFIGLLCSAVVVGFREGMNRTLQSAVEVELFTAMPSLALIPRRAASTQVCVSGVVASGNIASLTHPNSAVAEAFRGLGTSILLTAPELQVLVVTSPVSGEGKTTTAANTAVVLAQQGKRVLLVDADLRKPALHETFGVSNENGLNALLQGNVDQGGAIVRVPGAMIPDLLPAGAEASRPAELLGSAAMAELLNCWRHDYDYIIIDTPPMLAVTDALRLAAKADSVLLVVRASCTTREALSRACDVLNQTEVPVLGIVVNDIDVHSAGSYYYGCYPQLAKRYYCDD